MTGDNADAQGLLDGSGRGVDRRLRGQQHGQFVGEGGGGKVGGSPGHEYGRKQNRHQEGLLDGVQGLLPWARGY